VSLVAGSAPSGARGLTQAQGLLVKDSTTGTNYLLWQRHRHQLRDPRTVIPALFGAVVTPATAGTAWINAIPPGAAIGPITIDGRGNQSRAVPNRKIGDQLFATTGAGPQYWLVFDDGIAVITELQKAIVDAQFPAAPVQVSLTDINAMRTSNRLATQPDEFAAPKSPPKLDVQPATPADLLCAVTTDPRGAPDVFSGGTVDGIGTGLPTSGRSADGTSLADQIVVPAGRIAVIRVLPSPSASTGPYAIVTDLGVLFPVPSVQVLAVLGYPPDRAVDVPVSLSSRIPTGPVLEPAAALIPVAATAGAGTGAAQSPSPTPSPSRS
jgi:hypothetical protein